MQLPINGNLVEVDHPLLYLVIYWDVLEQLREVRCDKLLRSRRHLLLFWKLSCGAVYLGKLKAEARLEREFLKFLLDPLKRLHHFSELLLGLLVAALAASVQAIPILFDALLGFREQIDDSAS